VFVNFSSVHISVVCVTFSSVHASFLSMFRSRFLSMRFAPA
jgi:hypothetical protein